MQTINVEFGMLVGGIQALPCRKPDALRAHIAGRGFRGFDEDLL